MTALSKDLNLNKIRNVLYKTSTEGVIVIGSEGLILTANPSLLKMYGYSKDELTGQLVEKIVTGIDISNVDNDKEKVMSNKTVTARHKTGREFEVEVSYNHFTSEKQQMIMLHVNDLGNKGPAFERLKIEKETAEMYLNIAGTLFIVLDQNQNVKWANREAYNVIGCSEDKMIGRNWFENYIPGSHQVESKEHFEGLVKGNVVTTRNYQSPMINCEGEERQILWHHSRLMSGDGQISGALISGVDITERKQVEEELIHLNAELEDRVRERTHALEESQKLYRKIANNFPNGIIGVLDRDLKYIYADGLELHRPGVNDQEMIGSSFLDRVDPEERKGIRAKLLPVFMGTNVSFEMIVKNGVHMIHAVGLKDMEGHIDRILFVTQNITRQKQAELDILNSLEKERHLNDMKSRFVSMASHEFRTPLTTILNSTSLLSKLLNMPRDEVRLFKQVDRIKSAVQQLGNILNDFLSLEKLEEGKEKLNHVRFNIKEFSTEVAEEMTEISIKKQRVVHQHRGGQLFTGDMQMIRNICHNLITNSMKYSPEGSDITFKTQLTRNNLIITIKDHGIGIPREEQGHLFDRFFRASNALNHEGTGLGLNIVKKYVEKANGTIRFESEQGKGTTFMVSLPMITLDKKKLAKVEKHEENSTH
ncbi:MAG: PAS domain S-box protein [Vicingaceae bacterium]